MEPAFAPGPKLCTDPPLVLPALEAAPLPAFRCLYKEIFVGAPQPTWLAFCSSRMRRNATEMCLSSPIFWNMRQKSLVHGAECAENTSSTQSMPMYIISLTSSVSSDVGGAPDSGSTPPGTPDDSRWGATSRSGGLVAAACSCKCLSDDDIEFGVELPESGPFEWGVPPPLSKTRLCLLLLLL